MPSLSNLEPKKTKKIHPEKSSFTPENETF